MNILHLSTNYEPVNSKIRHGGVERLIYSLASVQSKEHNVTIVGLNKSQVKGVNTRSVYFNKKKLQNIRAFKKSIYDKVMMKANKKIFSMIENNKYNILHDHFGYFTSSLTEEQLKFIKTKLEKIIITVYGLPDNPIYKPIYEKLAQISMKHKGATRFIFKRYNTI